jgi:uncharacterized protein YkwD
MRAVVLALLALLPGAPALACDLALKTRPAGVAPYAETARACLGAPPGEFEFDATLEAEFLCLVNEERAAVGLAPLALRRELAAPARFHSLDMAVNGFFGHEGPDGRGPDDRMSALDRRSFSDFSAENVATVSKTGGTLGAKFALNRLHENLMESPGHRANILNAKATHAAFGVVRTKNGVWVTQLFLRLSGTLSADAPLRMGETPELRAPLGFEDWTFVRYDLVSPHGEPFSGAGVPPGARDARLAAYATQPGDSPNAYYWIRFLGPSVTLSR